MQPQDFEAVIAETTVVRIALGDLLVRPGSIDTVYFPQSGLISQLAQRTRSAGLEVALYGREGFGPVAPILGVEDAPHQHVVQGDGEALAVPAKRLRALASERPAIRDLLLRYVQTHLVQTGYTAVSNGSNVIGERLARWLLMSHDRVGREDLPMTHEFLGLMLGVRRSGVTDAIHVLEGAQVIKATRGNLRVINRAKLEEIAGDAYGIPEDEYRRLIGPI